MAPPTTKPRLSQIDSSAFGRRIEDLVAHHVARFALPLSPRWTLALANDSAPNGAHPESTLGLTAADLCSYAQRGLGATDWPDHGGCLDALQSVCEALYSQAGEPGTFGAGALTTDHWGAVVDDADPEDEIGLVLVAAHARMSIAGGAESGARELAALAGLSHRQIGVIAKQRDGLVAVRGSDPVRVRAAEAARWLASRGVAGFGSR